MSSEVYTSLNRFASIIIQITLVGYRVHVVLSIIVIKSFIVFF